MNINIIFLNYHDKGHSERVKIHNFGNANYPFHYIEVNKLGISNAINTGITLSRDYDAVITMANDILMPDNWLARMVEATEKIENTGMCGIHCVEGINIKTNLNGIDVHIQEASFGNVLIPMKAIKKVGLFNMNYDPYGMQDSDYAYRLNKLGFVNYYLHDLRSEHIGHDVGQDTPYRRMKDEGLAKCQTLWNEELAKYEEQENYTIYLPEYPI